MNLKGEAGGGRGGWWRWRRQMAIGNAGGDRWVQKETGEAGGDRDRQRKLKAEPSLGSHSSCSSILLLIILRTLL